MANVKITDLTALSGAVVGADLFEMVDDVAGTPASRKVTAAGIRDFSGMSLVSSAPVGSDIAPAINTLTVADLAGLSASRNFTLPATAAVGDRVGVVVSVTNATHALILRASAGDSILAGGSTFTAAEWTRVWIVGEVVVFRCIVADTTWIVEQDGRIPCTMVLRLTTNTSGSESPANTFFAPTSLSGAWTADNNRGAAGATSTGRFTARRVASKIDIVGRAFPVNAPSDGASFTVRVWNGTDTYAIQQINVGAAAVPQFSYAGAAPLAVGAYLEFQTRASETNRYCSAGSTFCVTEVL